MSSWNKVLWLSIWALGLHCVSYAQTVCYYQLTKTKINGIVSDQNNGGQFICIYDGFCYDCDINGNGVGNGQLHLKSRGEYIVYFGESFFGKSTYYKFDNSFSRLNVITPEGDIYAYKRGTPLADVRTCSLIKKQSGVPPSGIVGCPPFSEYGLSGNSESSQCDIGVSEHKNKVRKKCAYCSGRGEMIQHEYVTTFGLDGPRVYCRICNKSWNYGTVHAHHMCTHCKGTGYYEYEY